MFNSSWNREANQVTWDFQCFDRFSWFDCTKGLNDANYEVQECYALFM